MQAQHTREPKVARGSFLSDQQSQSFYLLSLFLSWKHIFMCKKTFKFCPFQMTKKQGVVHPCFRRLSFKPETLLTFHVFETPAIEDPWKLRLNDLFRRFLSLLLSKKVLTLTVYRSSRSQSYKTTFTSLYEI